MSSILLVSFVLMTINVKREKGPLFFETLVLRVFSPFQSLFMQTAASISGFFEHYFFIVNVSQENEHLKREINRLRKEKNELIEKMHQQKRIARLMEPEGSPEIHSVIASVIGRDATQWSKVVMIDKGTDDGIRENLAVVTDAGIIGHVIQSTGTTSKVLLITDSRSAVDALFQDSRTTGVFVGTGQDVGELKYVPTTAKVRVGDRVLSSGLGGTFPKGLLIGSVIQVTQEKQGLFQDIVIVPSADLSRLEEVLVLLP
ncbi:MAG: rod shape-determining protein MreC [Nitrospinaceae bacterium]